VKYLLASCKYVCSLCSLLSTSDRAFVEWQTKGDSAHAYIRRWAWISAAVFLQKDVPVYLFSDITPTPFVVSCTVRTNLILILYQLAYARIIDHCGRPMSLVNFRGVESSFCFRFCGASVQTLPLVHDFRCDFAVFLRFFKHRRPAIGESSL